MRVRSFATALLLPLLLLLVACEAAEDMEDDADDLTPAEVRAEMDAVRSTWMEAAAADDAAAVAALYAEDAVLVDQYGVQHAGRAAIEAFFAESFAAGSDVSTEVTWFGSTEGAAFESGTWSQTVEGPDGPMAMSGTYVVVSVRGEDDTWRIALQVTSVPQEMPEGM